MGIKTHFSSTGYTLNPMQNEALEAYSEGKDILIVSPTGTGKTLGAFCNVFDFFLKNPEKMVNGAVRILYVCPLKSLINDIYKNVGVFVADFNREYNCSITIGLRTGDTSQREKVKLRENPPHIFCTTVEGLQITLMNNPNFFESLDKIIVDEVHAMVTNKRGTILSLSIAWLREMRPHLRIIGMSATVSPLDRVAKFLFNHDNYALIRGAKMKKESLLNCYLMNSLQEEVEGQVNVPAQVERLLEFLAQTEEKTLVFTNTKNFVELMSVRFKILYPQKRVVVHHASMDPSKRKESEEKLKSGDLDIAFASSTLEQGIDFNCITRVIQVKSPKRITESLQRAGRAGHRFDRVTRSDMLAFSAEEALECSSILEEGRRKRVEAVIIPDNCLDIACQFAMMKIFHHAKEGVSRFQMLQFIGSASSYSGFSKESMNFVLDYLVGDSKGDEDRRTLSSRAYEAEGRIHPRYGLKSRKKLEILTHLGAIVQDKVITIKEEKAIIGTLDPMTVHQMKKGDIFSIGGEFYKYLYLSSNTLRVVRVRETGVIPSWSSELLPLSFEVGDYLHGLRAHLLNTFWNESLAKTREEILSLSPSLERSIETIEEYLGRQFNWYIHNLGRIPETSEYVLEHIVKGVDGGISHEFILHVALGYKMAGGLANLIARRFSEETEGSLNFEFADKGIRFLCEGEVAEKFPPFLKSFLSNLDLKTLRGQLEEIVPQTQVFRNLIYQNSSRSFAIMKNSRIPEYVLVNFFLTKKNSIPYQESIREAVCDYHDLGKMRDFLQRFISGRASLVYIKTETLSPFAMSLFVVNKDYQGADQVLAGNFFSQMIKNNVREIKESNRKAHMPFMGGNLVGKTYKFEALGEKFLVIGDVHIGEEFTLMEGGSRGAVDMNTLKKFKRSFNEILSMNRDIENVIFLGDLKDNIAPSEGTHSQIVELIEFLKESGVGRVLITKGNHDTMIERILGVTPARDLKIESPEGLGTVPRGVTVCKELIIGERVFTHGHRRIGDLPGKTIFMGHFHMSTTVKDRVGTWKKVPSFGVFEQEGVQTVVFPAYALRSGIDPSRFLEKVRSITSRRTSGVVKAYFYSEGKWYLKEEDISPN